MWLLPTNRLCFSRVICDVACSVACDDMLIPVFVMYLFLIFQCFCRVITRLIPEDDFVSLQNYGVLNPFEVLDKVVISASLF